MGQYYRPCLLAENYKENYDPVIDSVDCYILNNGAKLMESCYCGNAFIAGAIRMLRENKTKPFVWAGDYSDVVSPEYHGELNLYNFATADDFDTEQTKENCSDLIEGHGKLTPEEYQEWYYDNFDKFIINHSKKQFVRVPDADPDRWVIHPLSLLTANSNGRGGGDWDNNQPMSDKIGIWAYDVIESADEVPEGYTELDVFFHELPYQLVRDYDVETSVKDGKYTARLISHDNDEVVLTATKDKESEALRALYGEIDKAGLIGEPIF